jgi:hypothetical protein
MKEHVEKACDLTAAPPPTNVERGTTIPYPNPFRIGMNRTLSRLALKPATTSTAPTILFDGDWATVKFVA